ncbi:cryptochrome/photolyase family protein [Pelagicoccus sp. SDUM812003]|uniref:cryptochrome/photolyase family protein n=1 Tax=Pelagicoccus sp. SDUM812003 TaxID=3041267 RepID=UPI00280D9874|nr:cryptochrome/photolyase family protein [Pelagicoccus sp. SDUM812003]MDQ8202480.1 cryptochrome/photolyase family protein [Pelagicoccus sp. SDUM812003]
MSRNRKQSIRRLVVVLGDQLSTRLASFQGFDKKRDRVCMAEVSEESEYAWSSKQRTAFFFAAMRHFREELLADGYDVSYQEIGDRKGTGGLKEALDHSLKQLDLEEVVMVEPGEYRLAKDFEEVCASHGVSPSVREDNSFFCSRERFESHAEGRKQLRMEYFYREMRREHGVLMDGDRPAGGKWNFDASNRESFGKEGPERLRARLRFEPDELTRKAIADVESRFGDHPGSLDLFSWPVTRSQALEALTEFIEHELPLFGRFQDAMWSGEPFLHHSLLSGAMNVRLLDPGEVVAAAEKAYRDGSAPIEAVEGFVRQVLGWREYVRGIYWKFMPGYLERNALRAEEDLPAFYWTAETEMRCLSETIGQTLKYGYAHHIQRLMITGLFALLYGVRPQDVHKWYLAVYIDAVEWVELPNTLGMSQFADRGVMASKPYVASGKYIQRMSNYCSSCRYRPDKRSGDDACPFTVLYWDFLTRHQKTLSDNARMGMQLRNVKRLSDGEKDEIAKTTKELRRRISNGIGV